MTARKAVIRVRDLSFSYPPAVSGKGAVAIRHISLEVYAGELVVITGPSGSGKSTLARCLNGLIPHATRGTMVGEVTVMGMDTRDHDVPDFARHVGMVFQDPGYQLVTADVESEIAFGPEALNLAAGEIGTRIADAAGLLTITRLLGRPVAELSWGERQRVAIASVLALRPPVLVMDEPFSGLDAASARALASLLSDLRYKEGTAIIVFEHRTALLNRVADRFIAMRDGEIVPGTHQDSPGRPPAGLSAPGTVRSANPSVSFQDVTYRYSGSGAPTLDGICLDLFPGEVTVIAGPNGSGKTTLLQHCNGLLAPDRGSISCMGTPLAGKTVAEIARHAGLLGQHADFQIFESTVSREVAFGPGNLGKTAQETGHIVEKTLRACSLAHIDPETPPLGLSGGEKQRVALASVLAMETPVVILDEPTFGLDPGLKQSLAALLRSLAATGRTVIVATHDEEFGLACGNRFIRITAGRIESDERPCNGVPGIAATAGSPKAGR